VVEQAFELEGLQDLLQRLEISGWLGDATLPQAPLDLAVECDLALAGARVDALRRLREHLARIEVAATPLQRGPVIRRIG
jgi:hypothetical protein